MPNWCSNILIIEGEESLVAEFSNHAKNHIVYSDGEEDTLIDFNKFIPYPKELEHKDIIECHSYQLQGLSEENKNNYIAQKNISKEMLKEIMLYNLTEQNRDWIGWHTMNWGTKWNAKYVLCDKINNNTLVYHFDTAWSPPNQILKAMITKYPLLTFTMLYGEEGHFFSGFIRCKGNKVFESRQTNYKNNWYNPKTLIKKYKLEKCKLGA